MLLEATSGQRHLCGKPPDPGDPGTGCLSRDGHGTSQDSDWGICVECLLTEVSQGKQRCLAGCKGD